MQDGARCKLAPDTVVDGPYMVSALLLSQLLVCAHHCSCVYSAYTMATTLLVLLLVLIQTLEARRYAVIIDAGSSGSRVRIFSWKNSLGLPQEVKEIHSFKTSPGISDYVHDLPDLKGHVKSLVDEAIEAVPSDKHSITPLYLMATAGTVILLYYTVISRQSGRSSKKKNVR